jgi:hypothetical protein
VGLGDHLALEGFALMPAKKNVQWNKVDAGDLKAGSIEVVLRAKKINEPSSYRMNINQNHDANVREQVGQLPLRLRERRHHC